MDPLNFITGNVIAIGGLVTVAFGALIAALRKLPGRIWSWMLNRYTVRLEILDKDESFRWMSLWLSGHPDIQKTKNLSVATSLSNKDEERFTIHLVPAPGIHIIKYDGVWIIVSRIRKESEGLVSKISETFVLRILSRDTSLARHIIEQAKDIAISPQDGYADIYLPRWGSWSKSGSLRTRSLSTIVQSKRDEIIADVEKFYDSEQEYAKRGIPYQRGYLFYGPPGNGKTSFIRAIAGHFKLGIYLIDLKDRKLSDIDLQWLISSMPRRGLLLLEDIDQVTIGKTIAPDNGKPDNPKEESSGVTISGLLNALDGIIAGDSGRLVFMTTNQLELLPSSLIRPGRIDMRVDFPNIDQRGLEQYLQVFFGHNGFQCPQIIKGISPLSYADIQEIIMSSDDQNGAVNRIDARLEDEGIAITS